MGFRAYLLNFPWFSTSSTWPTSLVMGTSNCGRFGTHTPLLLQKFLTWFFLCYLQIPCKVLIIFFLASKADEKSIRLLQDGDRFKLCQFLHVEEGQSYWGGGGTWANAFIAMPSNNLTLSWPTLKTFKTCQIFSPWIPRTTSTVRSH